MATTQEEGCHITDTSNWSSTQSSSGTRTPLEGWSDVGSETTERAPEDEAFVKFQELSDAADHTEGFTEYLKLLMEVNSHNKHRFVGILAGGDCVEATELLHRRYSQLVSDLERLLHVPRQRQSLEHVVPVLHPPLASPATGQAAPLQGVSDCHEDRSLEAIFSEIGSEVTDEDVARLIRHWTS